MTGKEEVARQRQQLDQTFKRVIGLQADAEILSDFARYLCVLVSGFLEQAVRELLIEYARTRSDIRIQSYVEQQLRYSTNMKAKRLIEILGSFDSEWGRDLESFLVDEYKDAVDSIVELKNNISHGKHVGVTMARTQEYYNRVKIIVDRISKLCSQANFK